MPAQYLLGLKCEHCGRKYDLVPENVCEFDFAPLRVQYDFKKIKGGLGRGKIQVESLSIPYSVHNIPLLGRHISRKTIQDRAPDMWRYIEFLPIDSDQKPETSLGAGYTPLLRAKNLARALGVEAELYIKDDRANPTHSFKDRLLEVAVQKAVEFGFKKIACPSTGNLANSVAAYAARAGLEAYVFIPSDLEHQKIIGSAIFKPTVIGVKGTYDDVNRLCSEIVDAHPEIAFVNINLRPYYGDGAKTIGYEIAEQLGWKAPAHLVSPMAGASLINKALQGLQEFHLTGLIDEPKTKVYGAQAAGCSPVVNAVLDGSARVTPIPRDQIKTIAKSLAIGSPADGNRALKTIRDSGGWAAAVTDEEIIGGIELLAQTEGIWTETAGGVVIAVTKKLIEQGRIPRNDGSIELLITGDGYKTPEANSGLGLTATINPKTSEFDAVLQSIEAKLN